MSASWGRTDARLVAAHKEVVAAGGRMVIVGATPFLRRLLVITDLDQTLPLTDLPPTIDVPGPAGPPGRRATARPTRPSQPGPQRLSPALHERRRVDDDREPSPSGPSRRADIPAVGPPASACSPTGNLVPRRSATPWPSRLTWPNTPRTRVPASTPPAPRGWYASISSATESALVVLGHEPDGWGSSRSVGARHGGSPPHRDGQPVRNIGLHPDRRSRRRHDRNPGHRAVGNRPPAEGQRRDRPSYTYEALSDQPSRAGPKGRQHGRGDPGGGGCARTGPAGRLGPFGAVRYLVRGVDGSAGPAGGRRARNTVGVGVPRRSPRQVFLGAYGLSEKLSVTRRRRWPGRSASSPRPPAAP